MSKSPGNCPELVQGDTTVHQDFAVGADAPQVADAVVERHVVCHAECRPFRKAALDAIEFARLQPCPSGCGSGQEGLKVAAEDQVRPPSVSAGRALEAIQRRTVWRWTPSTSAASSAV